MDAIVRGSSRSTSSAGQWMKNGMPGRVSRTERKTKEDRFEWTAGRTERYYCIREDWWPVRPTRCEDITFCGAAQKQLRFVEKRHQVAKRNGVKE